MKTITFAQLRWLHSLNVVGRMLCIHEVSAKSITDSLYGYKTYYIKVMRQFVK